MFGARDNYYMDSKPQTNLMDATEVMPDRSLDPTQAEVVCVIGTWLHILNPSHVVHAH